MTDERFTALKGRKNALVEAAIRSSHSPSSRAAMDALYAVLHLDAPTANVSERLERHASYQVVDIVAEYAIRRYAMLVSTPGEKNDRSVLGAAVDEQPLGRVLVMLAEGGRSLAEIATECGYNGFDESKGAWAQQCIAELRQRIDVNGLLLDGRVIA